MRRTLLLFAAAVTAAYSIACGGSDAGPAATSPTPSSASGSPQTDGGTPEPVTPATVVDLASAVPVSTIYEAAAGDLRSDQPGLASGDVNGDGIDDLLIGARFADGPAGQDSGQAYLVLGRERPEASVDLGRGEQDLTLSGGQAGDNLGYAVLIADVDGDGAGDIILGAPFAGPPDQATREKSVLGGAVYIFLGGEDLSGRDDLGIGDASVVISGEGAGAFFGDSLAAADVDDDGLQDLLVGAPFDSSPETLARGGAVYVFPGRRQWPATLSSDDARASIYGADSLDEFGDFVAAGDVNGDGVADIIGSAEAADGPDNDRETGAEVHVVFGRRGLKGGFQLSKGDADVSVYGAHTNDTLGFSLAAGDLNGDGADDLVMGARLASPADAPDSRAGLVYVLFGGKRLPGEIDLAASPDLVATINGPGPGSLLGGCVAVADIDGDGENDLIMGTAHATVLSRGEAGAVYVMGAPAAGRQVSVLGPEVKAAVYGGSQGEHLASNLKAADLNGDGRLELIVVADAGAAGEADGPQRGRVYVLSLQ